MLTKSARCEGAFIGHALASSYDSSIFMALNVSQSLIEKKCFDGPDILSRHLHLYHMQRCEIGEITKDIYQQAIQHRKQGEKQLTREDFRFDQSTIDEFVQLTHKKSNENTSGCSPAQRSYPLAFCPFIADEDLYDLTMAEAKLTHFSPIAGQVAVIVNRICRSLLKNQTWIDAINSAFATQNIHPHVLAVLGQYGRFMTPVSETHPAYAPTVLNTALHLVSSGKEATSTITAAMNSGKPYCLPIVGILAGARWGIPIETVEKTINNEKIIRLRQTASALSDFQKTESTNIFN